MSAATPSKVRLGVRAALSIVVALAPVAALAWPRLATGDDPLMAYLVIMGVGTLGVNLIRDVSSNVEREGADQSSETLLGLAMFVGALWAAADVGRLHLTDEVSVVVRWGAVGALATGMALRLWAMRVNRFFANLLIIQRDRDHQVIDRGPYAVVRHPGYTTFLLILPAMGLAIGSWSSLVPFGLGVLVIVRRTAIEDRFLHAELEGYADYAARVRSKLLPGIY